MSEAPNRLVITISGPMRVGKTVIAAVIKRALLAEGIDPKSIRYGPTGIFASGGGDIYRKNLERVEAAIEQNGLEPNSFPLSRTIHILEDTTDNLPVA